MNNLQWTINNPSAMLGDHASTSLSNHSSTSPRLPRQDRLGDQLGGHASTSLSNHSSTSPRPRSGTSSGTMLRLRSATTPGLPLDFARGPARGHASTSLSNHSSTPPRLRLGTSSGTGSGNSSEARLRRGESHVHLMGVYVDARLTVFNLSYLTSPPAPLLSK